VGSEMRKRDRPSTINLQDWLPAKNVTLTEQWSADIQNLKAGEPVTRTIILSADGLTGVQLPDIKFAEIDGLKQYPDKAVTDNQLSSTGINGTKQMKVAIIPITPGSFVIPEISIDWWNTKSNKSETAVIPATTITVAVGAQAEPINNYTAPQNEKLQPSTDNTVVPQNVTEKPESPVAINDSEVNYWQWLSLLLASLWVYTLILLIKKKTSTPTAVKTENQAPTASEIKAVATNVEKKAQSNNVKATQTALISWAQKYYADHITNLTQITQYCSAALTEEIRTLNQALYSNEHASWSGSNLLAAFKSELANDTSKSKTKDSALRPLYKH